MKNNTKLIMETWRRFLKEGTEGIDEDGMVIEVPDANNPSALSPVEDEDLESDIETIDRMDDMDDMDDMHQFNPYDSSPIPPEGLYGAAGDDDYEGNDSIDTEAIKYFDENGIPHDRFGNPLDDSLDMMP